MKWFVVVPVLCLFLVVSSSEAQNFRSNRARIIGIEALDQSMDGGASTSIDVVQDICDEEENEEPFFDTILRVSIANDSAYLLRCNKISFSVPNADLTGKTYHSRKFSLVGSGEIEADSVEGELFGLGFDTYDGAKFFPGETTAIPANLGFRNVTVRVFCSHLGRRVTLKARTAFSFDNFDRCD